MTRRLIGVDLSGEEFDQAPDVPGDISEMAAEKARVRGTAV
ncbi:hypothetical protein [Streptomyces sp. 184]